MKQKSIYWILVLTLLLSSISFSGCSANLDEDASNKLEKDVYNIYEELKTVYADADSPYEVSSYLYQWGKTHNLTSNKLSGGNVTLTKSPTAGDSSAPTTIIQCAISTDSGKEASQQAAIALASLINVKEHGKVTVLFTMTENNNFTGAWQLTKKNMTTDYFIHLDSGDKSTVHTGSAASAKYKMALNFDRTTPTGTTAYKIAIHGLSGDDSSNLSGTNPNPIVILSNLLTSSRASGLLVELADIHGGTSAGTFPASASVLVMVDQTSESKFLARVNKNRENFLEKYQDKLPNVTYEIEKVTSPKSVISNDDSANILSLLYTTINGVYKTSSENGEGDIFAVANIGKISVKNNKMKVTIMARSIQSSILKEMAEAYHTTAYLSNASFKILSTHKMWPYNADNEFAQKFIDVATSVDLKELSAEPTFQQSECAVFYEKKKDINMISFSVNNADGFLDAKTLLTFMTQLTQKDS